MDLNYPVKIFSSLNKNSSARITKNGLEIKVSRFLHEKDYDYVIKKFKKWADKKIRKIKYIDFVIPKYEDSSSIITHNKVYELHILDNNSQINKGFLIDGYILKVNVNSKLHQISRKKIVEKLVNKLIIKDQNQYLKDTINDLNELYFNEKINKCRFKNTLFRFGSCSIKRNINISFKLLFAPREIFKYVCIHELAHLKEFNHSKDFWDIVKFAMPDYETSENWLKENGFLLG